jgi:CcmD family protein
MMIRRLVAASTLVLALALTTLPALAQQPPPQPPTAQGEFVPAKDLPATESIPAATLLVAAYAFIWVAAIVYLFSIWRRLNRVETEMQALARKTSQR